MKDSKLWADSKKSWVREREGERGNKKNKTTKDYYEWSNWLCEWTDESYIHLFCVSMDIYVRCFDMKPWRVWHRDGYLILWISELFQFQFFELVYRFLFFVIQVLVFITRLFLYVPSNQQIYLLEWLFGFIWISVTWSNMRWPKCILR